MATILVMNGPCEGQWFPVPMDRPLVVGRDQSLLAKLPDVKTSRRHLEVRYLPYENGYAVADKGSRNGVFVNGALISHYKALADEDCIRLGYTLLLFTEEDIEDRETAREYLHKAKSRHKVELRHMTRKQAEGEGKPKRSRRRFSLGRLFGWGRKK